MTASISVPPIPPSSTENVMPSKPCLASFCAMSHGYPVSCARRSAPAASSACANRRTESAKARSSSVNWKSTAWLLLDQCACTVLAGAHAPSRASSVPQSAWTDVATQWHVAVYGSLRIIATSPSVLEHGRSEGAWDALQSVWRLGTDGARPDPVMLDLKNRRGSDPAARSPTRLPLRNARSRPGTSVLSPGWRTRQRGTYLNIPHEPRCGQNGIDARRPDAAKPGRLGKEGNNADGAPQRGAGAAAGRKRGPSASLGI